MHYEELGCDLPLHLPLLLLLLLPQIVPQAAQKGKTCMSSRIKWSKP